MVFVSMVNQGSVQPISLRALVLEGVNTPSCYFTISESKNPLNSGLNTQNNLQHMNSKVVYNLMIVCEEKR